MSIVTVALRFVVNVLVTQTNLRLEDETSLLACAEDSGAKEANAIDTRTRMQKVRAEFNGLFKRYADDIEEELSDARERMVALRKKGRHSKALQRQIKDLERLVELRKLMQAKNASDTNRSTEELQAEFDELLQPYTELSGMSKEDIDEDLSDARGRNATLLKKGRCNKILQQKVKDLERLVELRHQLFERRTFATNEA